jgi:hypothetical protein
LDGIGRFGFGFGETTFDGLIGHSWGRGRLRLASSGNFNADGLIDEFAAGEHCRQDKKQYYRFFCSHDWFLLL